MKEFWNGMMLIRKQYAHRLDGVCRTWGITRAELDVLLFLAHEPELNRAADIVELRGLTKSHVSIAAKSLCEHGLLTMSNDLNDHRVMRLTLTEAAQVVVKEGESVQRCFFGELFGCLSPQELEEYKRLQYKLLDRMHKMSSHDE